ncbi:hypothetical protein COB57_05175 [Candidatus Peregrinibacteria bacterium]|nr:MAG: hypothetical protein COB57_05175 [Candidatus Peregrinibacteria bacterium]
MFFRLFIATGVFFLVQVFAASFYSVVDMTENQLYTFSPVTEKILQSGSEDIVIHAYISKHIPSQYAQNVKRLEDMLRVLQSTGSKFSLEIIDPDENEEAKKIIEALGIQAFSLQSLSKNKTEVVNVYFSLAVLHKRDSEVEFNPKKPLSQYKNTAIIQNLFDISQFEYDIVSLMTKMTQKEEMVIGFLTGHEEHRFALSGGVNNDPRADYHFKQDLSQFYRVIQIEISENNQDLSWLKTLVIAGAQTSFSDNEKEVLYSYVENGGNLIVLDDRFSINNTRADLYDHNRNDFLSRWGIKVLPSLLLDKSQASVSFRRGFSVFQKPYPFFPLLSDFSDFAITKNLKQIILPWVSPLEVQEKTGMTYNYILKSSAFTLQQVSEQKVLEEGEDAVQLPVSIDPDTIPLIDFQQGDSYPLGVLVEKEGEGKVFVLGTSHFINASFGNNASSNKTFFFNLVDSFSFGNDLFSIRTKFIHQRSLKELSSQEKNVLMFGNIIIVPGVIMIFGCGVWFFRRRKKWLHFTVHSK